VTDRDLLRRRALAGRLVAIVRLRDGAALLEVAAALVEGGITTLEFTLTTPGAVEAIERCRARFGETVVVGAGTVLDADGARRCLAAGAQFLVSPGFDRDVMAAARAGGALAMPGAMTPTEIMAAWRASADVVKVFPARALGPRYIADVRAPLPEVRLMPTGGVDATNAAEYLRAGAVAVAVGGNLVDPAAVARADWAALTARARALVDAVALSGAANPW
jgi:2-dehydro-3-deoxyphosphogluconate aldolase/(4S)-4-hydroxy-2-oxoglutarate aldolase